jgi:hypothetical protein
VKLDLVLGRRSADRVLITSMLLPGTPLKAKSRECRTAATGTLQPLRIIPNVGTRPSGRHRHPALPHASVLLSDAVQALRQWATREGA